MKKVLALTISKLEKNGVGGSGAPGLVFDTVVDMEAYIAESADMLSVGQNLYIRAEDVPDYWWDGTQALPVEGKTDLNDYITTEQLAKEIAGKVDSAVENALTKAKESGEFNGAPGKDGQDGYTPQKDVDYFDGKPGNDYVLTEADKTEIAEQAAGLVDTALLAIIGEVTE